MTVPTIADTAAVLAEVVVGQRLWFAFSPDQALEGPRLLLGSTASALESIPELPIGARLHRGVAIVDSNGRLDLCAPGVGPSDLEALAEWAAWHLDEHPALERLAGASLVDVAVNGTIRATVRDEILWQGFPSEMPVAGTAAAAAAVLEALDGGEDAWYWLTDAGVGGGWTIAATSLQADPGGQLLAETVDALRGQGQILCGKLRIGTTGRPVLTTTSEAAAGARLVSGITSDLPALAILRGATVVQTGAGGVVASAPVVPDSNPTYQAALLGSLKPGEAVAFSFMDTWGEEEEPMLFVETLTDRLPSGQGLRGLVRLNNNGDRFIFVSESRPGDFLPKLARWVWARRKQWPNLKVLRFARFVVEDADGNVLERIEDDEAWSKPTS